MNLAPAVVAAFIGAAYWFTSSTAAVGLALLILVFGPPAPGAAAESAAPLAAVPAR